MSTKIWICLLAVLMLVSLVGTLWLFHPAQQADTVTIISEGKVLYTLSLHLDQTLQIVSPKGTNTITIQNGKAAVTEADCPDGHCMARGFCAGGAQIVCLPNRLVLQFSGSQTIDGIVG